MRAPDAALRRRFAAALISAALALGVFQLGFRMGWAIGWPLMAVSFLAGYVGGSHWTNEKRSAAIGALVPLAVVAPSVVPAATLTQILVLAIAALGLNVLTGWTGQINLAQGVFVAFGAYTTALLVTRGHWPLLATIPVAGVVAAVAGLLLGLIALRFVGVYVAILTSALAIATPIVLKHYGELTGGASGISVPRVEFFEDALPVDNINYIIVLALAGLAALLTSNLLSGQIGRALWLVRDNPIAAAGVGINITRYKVLAFTVSSFWAGIAGAAYALTIGFVTPDAFGLFYGVQFLTMIVVGGLSTVGGAFIGAFIVYQLTTNVQTIGIPLDIAGQQVALPQQAVFGLILIAVVLLLPDGVANVLYKGPSAHLATAQRSWRRFRDPTGSANTSTTSSPRPLSKETS